MPRIQTYDTTLRDGAQGEGVNLSLQDKLMIAKKLDEMGFDYIEGGYPLSNPKDKEFFERAAEIEWQHAKIAAFGMTRRRGITADQDVGMIALRDSQAPVITIVGKTWDLHVHDVLRIDEQENLDMVQDSVSYLQSVGREIVYDAEHFFDGWSANPDFALKTIQAAETAGASIIVLCDTNGGSLPDRIVDGIRAAQSAVTIPLGIHCHNDCDVAVANSLAAVAAGAIQVQGTINGIGERCGNADLISVIANLALKRKADVVTGDGVRHLTELSRYVYEIANQNFRSGQAFVGTSAFAHKGGMHVHAVNRVARSYEHVEPKSVGNVRRVLISELSGRSNIVAKTTKYKLDHDDDLMSRILNRVQDLEATGYQFEAAEASFDLLVKKVAGNYVRQFERIHYRVNVETDGHGDTTTEATIKLTVKGKIEHVVAEGDGPVNALDSALRLALNKAYPRLKEMHLVDYKVRVINSTEGTAARVRVVIESADHDDVWNTVGVSENIIEASWLALVDSVEYKLHKDAGAMDLAVEESDSAATDDAATSVALQAGND